MKPTRVVHVLAVVAISMAGVARADTDGGFTAGTGWWSQNNAEAKFQEFREVPQGAFLEGFLLRQWDPSSAFVLSGRNAIRKDQGYGLLLARGARVKLALSYQQIPHLFSQVARLGYAEVTPGVFLLPDSLQAKNQANAGAFNSTMTDYLNNSAAPAQLSFRTDISKARLRLRQPHGWSYEVRATRRERSGRKPYGATFGFSNAIELVEPIDQRMLDVDGTVGWNAKSVSVRLGLGVSKFDNAVSTLIWDNPKRLTDSNTISRQGRLDLYPDNQALRGKFGMAWQLGSKSSVDAEATVSRERQNDPWLAFTINSAIPQASLDSLPARSTKAEAVDWSEDVRLHTRALANVTGTLRFHQRHYDNNTPVYGFIGRSAYDQSWTAAPAGEPFENIPFGNKQTTWGMDLDWDAIHQVKLAGTVETRMRDHTLREAGKDQEQHFEVSARAQPTDEISVKTFYGYGLRYMTEFDQADYQEGGIFIEQPNLRRFDVANRKQDRAGATIDASLSNALDVGVEYAYERNRYPASIYGLQETKQNSMLGQATMHVSEMVDLNGGGGIAWPRSRQASNETNTPAPPTADAATDWWAVIRDRSEWAFAGMDWWVTPKKVSLGLAYNYTRDQTEYNLTNGAGTAKNLPDTFYRRHLVTLEAKWRARVNTDLALRYGYDYFDVQDFAVQDVPLLGPTATAGTAVYLGDNIRSYVANQISVVYSRKF